MFKPLCLFFLIIGLLIGGVSAAPNEYNQELPSDTNLRGALFTDSGKDDFGKDDFYTWLDDAGRIHITSNTHYENKVIKIKYTALENRLKNFNGYSAGITHIDDNGLVTNNLINLGEPDKQGFVYITVDFSEIIINGYTGYTVFSGSNNGDYTLNLNSYLDVSNVNADLELWTEDNKRQNITFTNPATVDDYVQRLTVTYDSDMQTDFDDLVFKNDTGVVYKHNILDYTASTSATVDVKLENQDDYIYMYYGDSTATDTSDPSNVYVLWDGFDGSSVNTTLWNNNVDTGNGDTVTVSGGELAITVADTGSQRKIAALDSKTTYSVPAIVESRCKADFNGPTTGGTVSRLAFAFHPTQDQEFSENAVRIASAFFWRGDSTADWRNAMIVDSFASEDEVLDDTYFNLKMQAKSGDGKQWRDGTLKITNTATTTLSNPYFGIHYQIDSAGAIGTQYIYVDYVLIRQYLATEPTPSFGTEEDLSVKYCLVSVTGDSYNFTTNSTQDLTPTSDINSISFETLDTVYYNYELNLTWQQNTTLVYENISNGYANLNISFTPNENINNGWINSTYQTIDFSTKDYVCTGTYPANTTFYSNIDSVNTSVVNLVADTEYWFNYTVPYNNIPNVGTINDINGTANSLISFTFPTYSDDESNSKTWVWNFGDGNTSVLEDPTHIYVNDGNYTAWLNITESASCTPSTINNSFNVTISPVPQGNVTQADLDALEASLLAEISELETKHDNDINNLYLFIILIGLIVVTWNIKQNKN